MPGQSELTIEHQWYNPAMKGGIRTLPPEIVLQILSYLSIQDLLAFGTTCRPYHAYHLVSLKRLRLAVFEKRVHSIIASLQAGWSRPDQLVTFWDNGDQESSYTISVVRPQSRASKGDSGRRASAQDKPRSQEQMVRLQNQIFTRVVRRYGPSLRYLEFMAYDLNLDGAAALGSKCQHTLRHLALQFEHPVRGSTTWHQPAPPSEAWNSLIGIGSRCMSAGLHNLETLILRRAGITPWQLMMLVKRNPRLQTLKLRTCRGARPAFLFWLGGAKNEFEEVERSDEQTAAPGAKLEVFWLEHCHRLLAHPIDQGGNPLDDEQCDAGFEWVRGLKSLQSLSFSESANMPSKLIDRANKTIWKIPDVVLPYCLYDENTSIAVDPRWK
ncbi:hypothetical protein BJX68DRAFT_265300 [Aspergillus pseudodeflectus]|uniref:F-box domain-containing protein n=1 Tax=Aspergillus pseudodeflectus TaxID=176178 RepID=A0ABR4KML2_9EURO